MRQGPHIPLFLWVAAALVTHAIGGGGATEVVKLVEERMDIESFAQAVAARARLDTRPTEITLETATELPAPNSEAVPVDAAIRPTDDNDSESDSSAEVDDPLTAKSDIRDARVEQPKPTPELPKEEPSPPEFKEPDKPKEKQATPDKPDTVQPPMIATIENRRVAVSQNVRPDQEDNANARFAAEQANRVDEETQARITSSDQNDPNPNPGGQFAGSAPPPGNSEQQRVASSEAHSGDRSISPGPSGGEDDLDQAARPSAPSTQARTAQAPQAAQAAPPRQAPAVTPRLASEARVAQTETYNADSSHFSVSRAEEARAVQAARAGRLPPPASRLTDLLGYGSQGLTKNGVNLNLGYSAASAFAGQAEVARMRKRAGEQRLSQHRGSWATVGLEKWRSAIENYVAAVKPGNQTALNAARVPFAGYLNQIHNRLHLAFADDFLASLDRLPAAHPLNRQDMTTHVEITLSHEDGRIVKLGITKSSGVTMFDVGALEAVSRGAPYGIPPAAILSSDGNVYLHWEFHRDTSACSTYFARPYILTLPQTPAPERVLPPPPENYEQKPPDERSGQFESDHGRAHSAG